MRHSHSGCAPRSTPSAPVPKSLNPNTPENSRYPVGSMYPMLPSSHKKNRPAPGLRRRQHPEAHHTCEQTYQWAGCSNPPNTGADQLRIIAVRIERAHLQRVTAQQPAHPRMPACSCKATASTYASADTAIRVTISGKAGFVAAAGVSSIRSGIAGGFIHYLPGVTCRLCRFYCHCKRWRP
jgi:hypothetical protein